MQSILARMRRAATVLTAVFAAFVLSSTSAMAQEAGGEANLQLPDLHSVTFAGGIDGHNLLLYGLIVSALGMVFGLGMYMNLKNLPVHKAMLEISELIYETCKTYLTTQGKFIAVLWLFIAVVIGLYFGMLAPTPGHPIAQTVLIILGFSIIGILGSYGVAWFRIPGDPFANPPPAFRSLQGRPHPRHAIPLQAGIGHR